VVEGLLIAHGNAAAEPVDPTLRGEIEGYALLDRLSRPLAIRRFLMVLAAGIGKTCVAVALVELLLPAYARGKQQSPKLLMNGCANIPSLAPPSTCSCAPCGRPSCGKPRLPSWMPAASRPSVASAILRHASRRRSSVTCSSSPATLRTLALAAGEMTEAAYADWLAANSGGR
jgi:hypothetical protein